MHERPLAAQHSRQVWLFRRFETLVAYLKGIGIARFEVDAANFGPDPSRIRPPARPLRGVEACP